MNGCDSIITINLTINQPVKDTINPSACGSYTSPSGQYTWEQNGTYMDTLENAATNGCDSIITIKLTINNRTTSSINPSVCNKYEVPSGDETYTK